MGIYINPPEGTKEQWLAKYGVPTERPHCSTKFNADQDKRLVCLVDNGPFTAAGVCYSQEELDAFAWPDPRPKSWFLVPISALKSVIPNFDGQVAP